MAKTEETLKEQVIFERLCEEMVSHLSLTDALQLVQQSIESCVRENIETFSEEKKEEIYQKILNLPQEEKQLSFDEKLVIN